MHAFEIDAAKAFGYMRRLSQDQNVKLVRIAENIIESLPHIGGRSSEDTGRKPTAV